MTGSETSHLPHARTRLASWTAQWHASGALVLLLDFDGTLAPIVPRAGDAALPERTRHALRELESADGLSMALVSGRGSADVRERVGMEGLMYAGNHGMEIEGPGVDHRHEEARAARPALERVVARLEDGLAEVAGAWVEDKGVTLSVHYREVEDREVTRVRTAVEGAVSPENDLRVTHGKKVLEVRPDVDWHKGRAVEFLLDRLNPPAAAPVLYVGDDTTDEDAFRVLAGRGDGAEGVIVADPVPVETAARSFVRDPNEVAELLEGLLAAARDN